MYWEKNYLAKHFQTLPELLKQVRPCQMLGSWSQAGLWAAGTGPPPLSHICHSLLWLHLATYLLSWNGSGAAWPRQASAGRTGLSALAFSPRGPLLWVREEQRAERQASEAPRTTQERGNHSMAVPTAPLKDHVCPELDPASNPPWLPSALSTKSSCSAWHWGALWPFSLLLPQAYLSLLSPLLFF